MSNGLAPILVLDGAMGTVLQDYHSAPITSSLWSSQLLADDPVALTAVHKAYLEAGADVISTATYQCSQQGFLDNGFSHAQATEYQRIGVKLVSDVVSAIGSKAKCALSLGPYGATMQPGQEYGGIYPAEMCNKNALKRWHWDRLSPFLKTETWGAVDIVMFETIPREDEAEAISEMMAELEELHANETRRIHNAASACSHRHTTERKEWWISLVFPDGRRPDGRRLESIVERVCGTSYEVPRGIGVNCTKLQYLPELVAQYTAAVKSVNPNVKPTLVLYPDGGLTYDPTTKSWSDETKLDDETWAQRLIEVASMARESGVWGKVVVGGCCKAGVNNIRCLRRLVDQIDQ